MGKEYPAKSFKSGNSVAIRIPAELGLEAGRDGTISPDDEGRLIIDMKPKQTRRLDLTKIWGHGCGMKPLTPEERIIHPRPSKMLGRDED